MAEICCGVVNRVEPAAATVTAAAVEVCETTRAARRRRIGFRRFSFVAGVDSQDQSSEGDRKRKKMDVTAPIKKVAETLEDLSSCTVDSRATAYGGEGIVCARFEDVDDAGSGKTELAVEAAKDSPAYGVMSVCGRRKDMEDALSVLPDFTRRSRGIAAGYHFFGVYDGHGCSHVAVSCKERMHEIIAEELDRLETSPSTSLEWGNLMEKSFASMDLEAATWRSGPEIPACRCEFQTPKCDHVGSTAVVAVVSGEQIVVANCGDSRAVLCRNGSAVALSVDHKPDRPDELRRIEAAGGRVIYWDGARVLGVLAMSRAIGDNYLKPFVISKPEVTVTNREEGDDYLILACDGLWDVVTNETACQIVKMVMQGSGPPDGESEKACAVAAMLLTKLALARQSADNVSVVVVDLRKKL